MSERKTHQGERVEKPWGYELIWAKTDKYVAKLLFVKAGEGLSLQYHNVKMETLFLESGDCKLETGPDADHLVEVPFPVGSAFHIPPGTIHRMTARKDCRIFEVSTTELNDVVRLKDRYGRN